MILEEYCTWDTAKLLYDADFPQEESLQYYVEIIGLCGREYFAKPTQSLAMRWLREEHSISVEPSVTNDEQWCLNVFEFKSVDIIADDEVDRFPTYEAAAEAGIQAACKYLIAKEATHDTTQENMS